MNQEPTADSNARMLQLDGLRALAVAAVALSHWTTEKYLHQLPWGTGVQLFFVLSGFLITGILLRNRPAEGCARLSGVLKVFYLRRILRIFPLYYGVLILCIYFQVDSLSSSWPWHFSYLSNFYLFRKGASALSDPLVHLWSLSVEEQFYLIWPLLALTLPKATIRWLLIASIVIAPAFRSAMAQLWQVSPVTHYLTPSCLDALAIGGYLAFVSQFDGPARFQQASVTIGIIGAIGLLTTIFFERLTHYYEFQILGHTFLVMIYGFLVARASTGFTGMFGRLLNLSILQYFGKISYGIYVYHNLVPGALAVLIGSDLVRTILTPSAPIRLMLYSLITIVTAAVSWHFFESPINNFKRYFNYPQNSQMDRRLDAK